MRKRTNDGGYKTRKQRSERIKEGYIDGGRERREREEEAHT